MQVAATDRVGDERHVHPLGIAERGVAFRFERCLALRDPAENLVLELIRRSSGGGALCSGQASELPQDSGELALLPQQADPQVFEGPLVTRRVDAFTRARAKLLEFPDDVLLHPITPPGAPDSSAWRRPAIGRRELSGASSARAGPGPAD